MHLRAAAGRAVTRVPWLAKPTVIDHAIQVDVAGKQRRLVPLGDSGDEAVDQSAGRDTGLPPPGRERTSSVSGG